jgi:hypothetical protein
MHHAQDTSWGTRPLKHNIWFVSSLTVLYWEGHNSSNWSVIDVNEHLMKTMFDKLLNRSGPI